MNAAPWNNKENRGGGRCDERRCERCGYRTAGFLRMTKRLNGVLVLACEDCALELEREKEQIET